MKINIFLKKILLRGVGLVILGVIFVKIHPVTIYEVFIRIDIYLFLAAIIVNLLLLLLKAYRWKYVLGVYNRSDAWVRVLAINYAGYFLGLASPGQAGELAKVALLEEGSPELVPSIVADRLLDIIPVTIVGVLGGVLYLGLSPWSLLIVGTILVGGLYVFSYLKKRVSTDFDMDTKGRGSLIKRVLRGFAPLLKLDPLILACFIVGTSIIFYSYVFILSMALHMGVDFFHIALFTSIFALSRILPISIMGVGTRDALSIWLFGQIGVTKVLALSFSLSIFAVDFLNFICGFFVYQYLVGKRGDH